jgi:crossover junction endodeoxyribonuclease RusA
MTCVTTTITLPMPPSLNNIFVNVRGRGRVPSKKYCAWKKIAGWALIAQSPRKIDGPVTIAMRLARPTANSDLDNRIKPLLDLLVIHGVITDDRYVVEFTAKWADVDGAEITIKEVAV